jgi:uncharacterized protein
MSATIIILSDSHNNEPVLAEALSHIKKLQPQLIIHCGDFQSPNILQHFAGLPLRAVFGNCDQPQEGFKEKARALGLAQLDIELDLEIEGKKIYATHSHISHLVEEMAEAQIYDYIFHGHTHLRRDEKVGKTRIINPGALFRAKTYTFAKLDLSKDELLFIEIPR